MLQEKKQQKTHSNLYDSDSVYGWVSILLHWVTAIAIIVLWFVGKSITDAAPEDTDAQRQLHISIAASAWLVILIRVIWRFRSGHPHVIGQTLFIHRIAQVAHYSMLALVILMLVSGPMMVWSNGNPVTIFSWISIPGPIGASESTRTFAWFIHSNASWLLLWLFLLHVGGALKHLMFNDDDTMVRMIWPERGSSGVDR